MTAARRRLAFGSLADALADAERLAAGGYDRVGRWSLGQCCGHLAGWVRYPMDGFPPMPRWTRPAVWLSRQTVGRLGLRWMLAGGWMPRRLPTIPASVPAPGADDRAGVEEFRRAVGRWRAFDGPTHPEPLVGPMSRAEWEAVHRVHAAHHLSLLVPRTERGEAGR